MIGKILTVEDFSASWFNRRLLETIEIYTTIIFYILEDIDKVVSYGVRFNRINLVEVKDINKVDSY